MKLLLIAGMGESVALAQQLSHLSGIEVVAVTEGRAVARAKPPVRVHDTGFADDLAFARFIEAEGFDMIVDAAHPFQFTLGRVALATGRSYLRMTRRLWPNLADWKLRATLSDAVADIPENATVFAVTGRGSLAHFGGRSDLTVYCRQLEQHDSDFPLQKGAFVFGAGPFGVADEAATFTRLGITHLVLRNSGSVMGYSKLEAAAQLGVQVEIIAPPRWNIPKHLCVPFEQIVDHVRAHADH